MAFVMAPSVNSARFRVLIASEYALVRDTLDAVIKARANMEVVAHAVDARIAIAKSRHFSPDVLVLDATIVLAYGPNIAPQIKTLCPRTRILVLSDLAEHTYPAELFRLGVAGCVSEKSMPETFLRAVEAVGRGQIYLDPSLTEKGMDGLDAFTVTVKKAASDAANTIKGTDAAISNSIRPALSEKEHGILRRAAQGYSGKEIASQLHISVKTVETYKGRAMEKLHIDSRVDLVNYAVQQQWLK